MHAVNMDPELMDTAIAYHRCWRKLVAMDYTVPFDFCSASFKKKESIIWQRYLEGWVSKDCGELQMPVF
jgi:hypothetical protein